MVFDFEKQVIDPILIIIRENQEYLTYPENLPQLAKLGFMYGNLWYIGRVCYGQKGIIFKSEMICEDNPKYKLEMVEPIDDDIDELIYDAWGMHDPDNISWKNFSNIVLKGKVLTELEKKSIKPNKTFDEWVEIKLHPEYKYKGLYPDRKSIIDFMLFVIGTRYGYENGYIFEEASGADKDKTLYGNWENAIFREDIKTKVDEIMAIPELEIAVETKYLYSQALEKKKNDADNERIAGISPKFWELLKNNFDEKTHSELMDIFLSETEVVPEPAYKQYYRVNDYSIIWKFDENTHPSYILAGIEACEDIISNSELEWPENVFFAKNFIKRFKK